MSVSRETVAKTVRRFDLPDPDTTTSAVEALLRALTEEPDPPTTVREPREALDVHVADSLAGVQVEELRNARRLADLGAGAGFPGLALAAALPQLKVDLVESVGRKCEVIDRLALAAGLDGRARAIPARAEDWAREEGAAAYDVVSARALASLPVLCEYAAPLLRVDGVFIAWKGARQPDEENAGARAAALLGLSDPRIIPVIPYSGSRERHLYVYSKVKETPTKVPRRTGVAAKRPLG